MSPSVSLFAKSAFTLFAASFAAQAVAQDISKMPVISLTAGMYVIKAEVASNATERERGLMFREQMQPNEGMVFVFDKPHVVCMWMKNTLLPLSVAFIDKNGKIINIENMQPLSTDPHCAKAPAYYALEMNQGWFKKKNIKPDSKIEGLPPAS